MQLRFTSFAVINSRRDLHPQECAHAGRTKETPQQVRGNKFHKSVYPENYAVISRIATKAKESVADRTISDRLVKLKAF